MLSVIQGGVSFHSHTFPLLSEIPIPLSHTRIEEKHLLSQDVLFFGAIEVIQDLGLIPDFYSQESRKAGGFVWLSIYLF
jgi:hypothetical protein